MEFNERATRLFMATQVSISIEATTSSTTPITIDTDDIAAEVATAAGIDVADLSVDLVKTVTAAEPADDVVAAPVSAPPVTAAPVPDSNTVAPAVSLRITISGAEHGATPLLVLEAAALAWTGWRQLSLN